MNPSPMRSGTFVGAIRGPVLLITIGMMLAIDHSGSYPFSRTWPVLIIVIGLMKLLERTLAPRVIRPAEEGGNRL